MRSRFSREECKEWLDIGMKVSDSGFCAWLRDEVEVEPLEFLNYRNEGNLREQYRKYLMESKLSAEVIEELKKFNPYYFSQEQRLLINKLIPNEKLRDRYKNYRLCQQCQQPNTGKSSYNDGWCQPCASQYFIQNFDKWTSGNSEIDRFIQKHQLGAINPQQILEWIPYDRFTDIEYLAEGGFSKVYKTRWTDGNIRLRNTVKRKWERYGNEEVVLKSLNNSRGITEDLLQEIANHKLVDDDCVVVRCYGISQDPKTRNYIMVMKYIISGNLRQYLNNNYSKLNFSNRLYQLWTITKGLNSIHERRLIHRDFHSGNILNHNRYCYITDLGLCRPIDKKSKEGKVYGVLPYMAPEVLRKKLYTSTTDIYSFGIVAYELLSGKTPYHEHAHEEFLAIKICQGLRPNLNIVQIPQLLKDLINCCWDADPLFRPIASEIEKILHDWQDEVNEEKDTEFFRQYKETKKFKEERKEFYQLFKIHPQAIYTSRLLDYKNLPEPINSQKTNEIFYKLSEELEELRITDPAKFSEELKKRIQEEENKLEQTELEDNQFQTYQELPPKNN